MKIQVRNYPSNVEVVGIEGDLDFDTSPQLREEFAKLIQKKAPKVLVNLRHVKYIHSSGLATFVEFFQKLRRYQGALVLFNLSESVRGVFEIAKLDTIFHLAKSEQDAFNLAG